MYLEQEEKNCDEKLTQKWLEEKLCEDFHLGSTF